MTARLPDGFVVRLGRRVRVLCGGRVLIGGTPTTVLSLGPRAVRAIERNELYVVDDATSALANRLLDRGLAHPIPGPLQEATEKITVVVPVRDRPEQLRRTLASIEGPHRVIVVDDASENPDAVASIAGRAGAEVIRLDINRGPAAARNAGLALTSTPLVAFVDSDVELSPHALHDLACRFVDPRVALVAPRVRGRLRTRTSSWLAVYDADRSSLDLGADAAVVRPRAPVAWLPSACLLARTEALGDGFDPDLRVGEDVDLVWRLVAQGRRVLHVASVQVFHDARTSGRDVLGRRFIYGTSAGELARRHGPAVAPAVLSPWNVVAITALLSQRRWSLPLCGAVTALTAARVRRKLPADVPATVAVGLAGQGFVAGLTQTGNLVLRHWWPLGLVGAVVSRRLRRFVFLAAVLEAVAEHRRCRPRLDIPRFLLARRLDDVAYGTGVWWGAARARAWRALLPELTDHRRRTR